MSHNIKLGFFKIRVSLVGNKTYIEYTSLILSFFRRVVDEKYHVNSFSFAYQNLFLYFRICWEFRIVLLETFLLMFSIQGMK